METFGYPVCKDEFKALLEKKMEDQPALVISTTYCPYCKKAKALLNRYGIGHNEMMLDGMNPNDSIEIANCVYGRSQRFVPFIFLKGQPVGGYGELMRMHEKGVLREQFS
jgi:glutaredoxin